MNEEEEVAEGEEEKKPAPIKAMIFSAIGALAMGGAAAGAAYFLAPGEARCVGSATAQSEAALPPRDVTYVNLDPLVVTLGPAAKSRYLKISLSLETTQDYEESLSKMRPRIRDTLNTYLRAVEEDELIRPSGMTRLRAQMLRRLRLAAPGEIISDVLITDFVLN